MTLPQEVHDALTRAGGKNLFGKPNYKFAWSGTETYLISNGTGYEPFRICNDDCWLLMRYEPAEFWGSREQWERDNWEPSGLLTAGPYPSEGRYRVLRKLRLPVIEDGAMTWKVYIPTRQFVDEVFPGIKAFHDLTEEQKSKHIADNEKAEKAALAKSFARSREDYRGAATAKQVAQKVEVLEKYMGDEAWQKNVAEQIKGAN